MLLLKRYTTLSILALACALASRSITASQFTLISKNNYKKTRNKSKKDTAYLINHNKISQLDRSSSEIIFEASHFFNNRPYLSQGANGEGEQCEGDIHQHTCEHIQQDPIYRTDGFDCTTYVTQVLALLDANNPNQYLKNLLMIKYGAANKPASTVTFYNRNNFISCDFNRINHLNGLLQDASQKEPLKRLSRSTSTIIDRQSWFKHLPKKPTIRVFNKLIGKKMLNRLDSGYPSQVHVFPVVHQAINYIPLSYFFTINKTRKGSVIIPVSKNIDQIPTPSVIEIIRNDALWKIHGITISKFLHTGILVSHMGILFRHRYPYRAHLFTDIECNKSGKDATCIAQDRRCNNRTGCNELMFTQATSAYPNKYFFFRDQNGKPHCQRERPLKVIGKISSCNRVETLPFTAYFARIKNRKPEYLNNKSILGIHIEYISKQPLWKHFK